MPTIHATSACFPGFTLRHALDRITAGVSEPIIGALSAEHVQCCPQSFGQISEREAEALRQDYPGTQLRLHANARVIERHVLFDASTVNDSTLPYFHALADRSRRLGASAISIHAGHADNADLPTLFDNLRRLQDQVFGDVRVALEGLYPHPKRPQLLSTWADYEALLRADLPYAVDLSHLHIVRRAEGDHLDLVRELIASPNALELHVSGNDGCRDEHALLVEEPWWLPLLDHAGPNAIVFSESNQTRAMRPFRHHH